MKTFVISLLCLLFISLQVDAKKHILYVGTYTKGIAKGIFVYSFNDQSGRLVDMKRPAISNNPSFLTISPNKKFLYAVSELDSLDVDQRGSVSAFRIESDSKLTLINHVLTYGANPCYVGLSPNGKNLVTSNYTGGNLSIFNVLADGSLSEMVQRIQHEGKSSFPGKQTQPHPQSVRFDATGKLLYVADLGIDELKIYDITSGEKIALPHAQPFFRLAPGSGPRHIDFSTDGRFIYVINELNSTIAVLMKYGGEWKQVQTIKTLPKDFRGENWGSDIHLSVDGRFVYGSNLGHNSIAVFKRDPINGKLVMIETVSVEGNWPQNFTIDPSGRFLLVANQKSNDIVVFKIDQPSGKLIFTGFKVPNESPVCLLFSK
jgi:6-phosphogluconolactonase